MAGHTQPPTQSAGTPEQPPEDAPVFDRLHMLCDHTFCSRVITLGVSVNLREAEQWNRPPPDGVARQWTPPPDAVDKLMDALHAAAVIMGWRREAIVGAMPKTFCPLHTDGLVCSRCLNRDCSCVGGPGFDVVRR